MCRFKPINTSLYLCDNKFHTEALDELLEDDDKFGFIVMDGNGSLYGTLQGNNREVLHKFSVDLPKKYALFKAFFMTHWLVIGTDVGDNLHCDSQDSGWRSATTMCARWPSLLSRCSRRPRTPRSRARLSRSTGARWTTPRGLAGARRPQGRPTDRAAERGRQSRAPPIV